MSTFKVMVVDDEAPARSRLKRMLLSIADVEVVAEAADGEEALQKLSAPLSVDGLFLDIRMPRMDGISLAAQWAQLPPIVFTTAYDAFAVKAFEVNAIDYLLKPIRQERLVAAIEKLRSKTPPQAHVAHVLETQVTRTSSRVVTNDRGTLRFFEASQLSRFWSDEKYTLFLADGNEHVTEEPLSSLEERLKAVGFIRVHRSELVNVHRVKSLHTTDGMYEIELDDGQRAKVSRRNLSQVKQSLGV